MSNKTYLSGMNPGQLKAATHGAGPMLVLAGPGSGKTFTITNRISCLIEEKGVSPDRILVITFTKDAALSMQRRFLNAQSKVMPVNFGTFHAIFYQILKRTGSGIRNGILTDSEKRQLLIPILDKLQKEKESAGKTIRREELYEEAPQCLSAISFYKNTGRAEESALLLPDSYRENFTELLGYYEDARKRSGKLDFDDMLYGCLTLLQTDSRALCRWQEQFQYLLIDEFQDINPMQYKIIRLLALPENNLFAVGDDDQSIYGFRGSDPTLMRQFLKDYPGCTQVLLGTNYRSRPEIVTASLQVINENKNRFVKELSAAKSASNEQAVILKSFGEQEEQYDFLLQKLREDAHPAQCAVLFRTNIRMQGFASLLVKAGIPFSMKEKSSCIYDHFVAKDLRSYVRFACGENKRSLFLGIMNKPSRYISREAVGEEAVNFDKIRDYYRRYGSPGRTEKILADLSQLEAGLARLQKSRPYLGLMYLRKGMGYEAYLHRRAGTDQRHLQEWMELLELFCAQARECYTWEEWLERQEISRDAIVDSLQGGGTTNSSLTNSSGTSDSTANASDSRNIQEEGVHLMTAHGSKGLEFDRVYIPDLNEGNFPHGSMLREEVLEEERRILYVAMTRAKEALILTYVTGTKERPRLPSRFLNPLL